MKLDLFQRLKDEGKLVRRDNYLHPSPFCYRSHKPLIYRAVSSWFVDMGKIKETMVAANKTIRWVPDHLRDGRFGKWLEGARDWALEVHSAHRIAEGARDVPWLQ